jgi:hypothetical protein
MTSERGSVAALGSSGCRMTAIGAAGYRVAQGTAASIGR